jgi:hypothetical protein
MHDQPHEKLATRRRLRLPDGRGTGELNIGRKEQAVGAACGEITVFSETLDEFIAYFRLQVHREQEIP